MAGTAGDKSLDAMTKSELLAYAEQNGITGVNSAMLKSEIMKVIKGAV